MPRFVVLLLIAAGLVLAVFVLLVALVWTQQERIVFQPPSGPWPTAPTARRIEYVAPDGVRLHGYLVGDHVPGAPLLLAFHGNADLAVWQVEWARDVVARTGWAVLAAEYRGYAGNAGTPTYAGSALDARAAWQVARDTLGVAPGDIALFGHSLGSAIATELASARDSAGTPPRVLLLQSPFSSARDMARIVVARPVAALWSSISRVHFDTEARVRALGLPVHVAHGDDDLVIPLRMGRAVHAAARVKGALLVLDGAGHNDVPDVGGEDYWQWVARALGPAPGAGRAGDEGRP